LPDRSGARRTRPALEWIVRLLRDPVVGLIGGRPPHLWLEDGRSLFDQFGFEWTLLRLGKADGKAFSAAAGTANIDLKIVDVHSEEARDLYQADLALIRPDQIVAWRGNDAGAAGTSGFTEAAVSPDAALQVFDSARLVAPVAPPRAPHGELTAARVVPPCQPPCQQLSARVAVLRVTIGGTRATW